VLPLLQLPLLQLPLLLARTQAAALDPCQLLQKVCAALCGQPNYRAVCHKMFCMWLCFIIRTDMMPQISNLRGLGAVIRSPDSQR